MLWTARAKRPATQAGLWRRGFRVCGEAGSAEIEVPIFALRRLILLALRFRRLLEENVIRHFHEPVAHLVAVGWGLRHGRKARCIVLCLDAVYGQPLSDIFRGHLEALPLAGRDTMQVTRRADRAARGHRPEERRP